MARNNHSRKLTFKTTTDFDGLVRQMVTAYHEDNELPLDKRETRKRAAELKVAIERGVKNIRV